MSVWVLFCLALMSCSKPPYAAGDGDGPRDRAASDIGSRAQDGDADAGASLPDSAHSKCLACWLPGDAFNFEWYLEAWFNGEVQGVGFNEASNHNYIMSCYGVYCEGPNEELAWPTKKGPWFYTPAIAVGSPCLDVVDCWPTNVRMSRVTQLSPNVLHEGLTGYKSIKALKRIRCEPVGPYGSSICVLPCLNHPDCGMNTGVFEELPGPAKSIPVASAPGVCIDWDRSSPKPCRLPELWPGHCPEPCRQAFEEYATCTRFAVRYHRRSPCARSNAHGTCEGTLRCLQEDHAPHCDAPTPSAAGCFGKTPPTPMPPECCQGEPIWDENTEPCKLPDAAQEPRCGLDRPACAEGWLCVPLRDGQRCLLATAPASPLWSGPPGCWPERPSHGLAGGDAPYWAPGPGPFPNAVTPTTDGTYYDLRLDWAAARGMPCRNDADCKIPFTSPFGQRRWLQGSLRCAEDTPGEGGRCLKPCDLPTTSPCHAGYECDRGPGGWRWCVPEAQVWPPRCSVLAVELATEHGVGATPCVRANPFGVCTGLARCAKVGSGTICDAPEPAAETCGLSGHGDGVDQDCDGQTDEGCTP